MFGRATKRLLTVVATMATVAMAVWFPPGCFAEEQQQQGSAVNAWAIQLAAAIKSSWVDPEPSDHKLTAVVHIELAATGRVNSVAIKRTSGDARFDESLVLAVKKASPLPLPSDPALFNSRINITFSP